MAGLLPAIHVFLHAETKDVDARDEPGHDELRERLPKQAQAERSELLLAVAQAAIDRAEHVRIIVGPDPLLLVGLGLGPDVG